LTFGHSLVLGNILHEIWKNLILYAIDPKHANLNAIHPHKANKDPKKRAWWDLTKEDIVVQTH
jgi:hypothetical protein